jgi:hypothetical protein
MFGLISNDELRGYNQIMVQQLKNRYGDPGVNARFMLGVDRSKMRLYDVEQEAQDDLLDGPNRKKKKKEPDGDRSVFDSGKFMTEDMERGKPKSKFDRSKFEGFK